LLNAFRDAWKPSVLEAQFDRSDTTRPEAGILSLDSSKAKLELGWRPRLTMAQAVALTAQWYRAHTALADMRAFSERQIDEYVAGAENPLGQAAAEAATIQETAKLCA
jgi:CDP-glucose 4,6-dehydratase